eukprot:m.111332 g.111332  ORF g.111332 m.111332 type:complete len:480 (+) comp13443_c0_seq1:1288-2727(+)
MGGTGVQASDPSAEVAHKEAHHAFRVYGSRWFMLAILVLLQISNAMVWIGFSPIISIAQHYYDTTVTMIDVQSIVFMAVSVPLGFVGSWALNTLGLRKSIVAAGALNGLGAAIRFAGDFASSPTTRLVMTTVGQVIAACAQPFLLDSPTLFAATWFAPDQRAEANTIASVANPLGIAIGSLVSGLMVNTGSDIRWMLLANAAPAVAFALLALVFFKDKPPTPPSHSAEMQHDSFKDGFKKLMKNGNYWLLLFGFGIGIALISSISSLLNQLTAINGYTSDQAGYFSLGMVGTGLVGAGISGAILDKTKAFMTLFKTSFVGALGGVLMFTFVNKPNRLAELIVANCIIGFFAFAALPVGMELCAECTFPVSEGLSAGLIWVFSQALSTMFLFATNAATDGYKCFTNATVVPCTGPYDNKYYDYKPAMYMFLGFTAAATLAVLCLNVTYKRLESEREYASQSDAQSPAQTSDAITPLLAQN